jgi:hypothetical protein
MSQRPKANRYFSNISSTGCPVLPLGNLISRIAEIVGAMSVIV